MSPKEFQEKLAQLCREKGIEEADMSWEEVIESKEQQRLEDEEAIRSGAATHEEIYNKNDAFGFKRGFKILGMSEECKSAGTDKV